MATLKAQLPTVNDHLLHLAGEDGSFCVRSTDCTSRKRYRGSLGFSSLSSAGPEGRFPAYKEIHERGIVRREEFFLVLWIASQF